MHGYVPGEQPQGGRVIKLNTNENPYPPAPGVVAAVQAAASADLRLYPEPSAKPLREEAARRYGVRPEQVLAGNGSDEILTMLMRAIVGADAIADLASGFAGVVVVDEAYVDFAPAGSTALPLLASHPNVMVLRTFSKSFSLAGMRIGLAFGHPDLIAEIAKVKDSYNLSRVAIAAGTAALGEVAWMEQ